MLLGSYKHIYDLSGNARHAISLQRLVVQPWSHAASITRDSNLDHICTSFSTKKRFLWRRRSVVNE